MRRIGALLALMLLSSCGSSQQGTLEGLVVDVQGDLSAVSQFSVLTESGIEVLVPATDGEFAFPLQHLREHILSGVPVVVFWELRGGEKFAVFVDDAGESSH